MPYPSLAYYPFGLAKQPTTADLPPEQEKINRVSDPNLAGSITRKASSQTYFTIRYLVDRPLVANAYRAYAYFRWVDDMVDQAQATQGERLAFLARQQTMIARCCQGEWLEGLCPEEQLAADLIRSDKAADSGLHTYINRMMAVMVFDTGRRGQLISQAELADYTHDLATAVTEALHYFIGHQDRSPQDETRYLAVSGAHITHMLRDATEDTAVGYYNIPQEYLQQHNLVPTDVNHPAYCAWVQQRVQLARDYFALGRTYLARVENRRCRLAGHAYIARFEVVLNAIEKDDYRLRPAYPERKSIKAGLKMILPAMSQTFTSSPQNRGGSMSSSHLGEIR